MSHTRKKGGEPTDEFSVSLEEYVDPVEEVKVYLTENRENIGLGIEVSEEPPEGVEALENLVVYSYIRISTALPGGVVERVDLLFSVEKEWTGEIEGTVKLYWWDGSGWKSLDVTQRSDNETHLVYSATLPEAATLMIGGTIKEASVESGEPVQGFRMELALLLIGIALLIGWMVSRRR